MNSTSMLHELVHFSADRDAAHLALTAARETLSYGELAAQMDRFANVVLEQGLLRSERVAIYLEKRFETVIASFGTTAAGGIFVPINPLLKPEQVGHILRDCGARVLVTSLERYALLEQVAASCHDLRHIILTGHATKALPATNTGLRVQAWPEFTRTRAASRISAGHRQIDTDVAAILYTSGSTGRPKGVVLSHRNMVAGAKSVAQYLGNNPDDYLLAALPLSFDAGFSQLTTAFHVGARVKLLNYLMPRDVLRVLFDEKITGLTAVPPLYIQLSNLAWDPSITRHLRYFANTGGRMPKETLAALRKHLPETKPYLMYGLTEAFRSTYLPPSEVDRRPDSIGKAIPNAEILVLRDDGTECAPGEVGELVHRGALVGLGYWRDAAKTSERYRPLPEGIAGHVSGLVLPEIAVYSGDNVSRDEEGFLYFVGRRDEMIKTSGYRVSPTEIEEVFYETQLVGEVAAFGVEHPTLGHAIVVVVTPKAGLELTEHQLLTSSRARLPQYMIPAKIDIRNEPLPRNPNGKIDRKALAVEFLDLF